MQPGSNILSIRILIILISLPLSALAQPPEKQFSWPDGKKSALSLTFDDARTSQVDTGIELFEKHDVKVTFYVLPGGVENRMEGWETAVSQGHEIGNHSLVHPCSGNFPWAREKALEDYTLEDMEHELTEANRQIKELLGVTPVSFAYPCGHTYVGRELETKSYVPLVHELFSSGRRWLDEGPNDPEFCDMAQLFGLSMDAKDFDQIKPILEAARENGSWVVLAGHEIGESGYQTTRVEMLGKLIEYAKDPKNGIWLEKVDTVTRYIDENTD